MSAEPGHISPSPSNSSPGPEGSAATPPLPRLAVEVAPSITFATHQAAVPLVRSLTVVSPEGAQTYETLRVELSCDPAVVLPQTWHVSRLRAGEEIEVRSRDVKLDGGLLDRLTERMRAEVTIRLLDGETVLDESRHELIALARNEWGGSSSMPELLAAFILPNDPAVAALLADASDLLRGAGRPHSFEGYQSGTRERPWEMASAIWAALANRGLIYAEPPASFESAGQKIRTPSQIAEMRLATCLDSAVLFAAAIEQAGLHPIVCLVKGHALVGAWLRDATLPELITDDASLLRRYAALQDIILFETTLVSGNPPAPFGRAIEAGLRHISEKAEGAFVYALDVKQARGRSIHPLPTVAEVRHASAESPARAPELALESAPALPAIEDLPSTTGPLTPAGRVAHWKRKLLDLTKRNRLLNLKPGKTAIRLICPDVAAVEDLLAAEEKLTLIPLERLAGEEGGRDANVFVQQTRKDYAEEFARRALERKQLVAEPAKPELQAGLVELYRKAATDLREGGANTLFLAIGSLRWRPTDKADGPLYRAPILLVPVTLERASAATAPKLRRHPDDTVVNMTLLEMLRHDFEIVIPELIGPLPMDDSGVNVAEVMRLLSKAIGDARGWSVENDVVLSTFSFAKYLMWKDLCDRTEELKKSRFVAHMIDTPHERYERNAQVLDIAELDRRIDPKDLFAPLPADSSQVAAIHASGSEGDMVLEGPPGTGKSQTIANIIAHNLALGRRVLFVAEKMTALSVVHDRLARVGLGDFCLELHSSKASRRAFVEQLDKAWRNRESRIAVEWEVEAAKLKAVRERLNGLVHALHAPAASGISARQAIATACASPFDESVTLDWGRSLDADRVTSPEVLDRYVEMATALGEAYSEIREDDREAFADIEQTDWSYEWAASLADAAGTLISRIDEVTSLAPRVARVVGTQVDPASLPHLRALADAANGLADSPGSETAAFLTPQADRHEAGVEKGFEAVKRFQSGYAKLPHKVDVSLVATFDHDGLAREWQQAQESFVLLRFFKLRGLRKRAAAAWRVARVDDVGREARALATLKAELARLARAEKEIPPNSGWSGLDTDEAKVRAAIASARHLRASAARLASEGGELSAIRDGLARTLAEGRERFAPGMPDGDLIRRFGDAHKALTDAIASFVTLAKLRGAEEMDTARLRGSASAVMERSRRLNPWCRWQRQRTDAEGAGLGAIVRALTAGAIPANRTAHAFRVAYARWLAPLLIDARPELRDFSAIEHERLITTFRALDQKLSEVAAAEIRARLSKGVPRREERAPHKGYGILTRELQVKRSSRSVRTLLSEMGPVVNTLMPCVLMSPLSVAQFVPANAEQFDLVIFDEASQITTWDAIGAIARGRNVIIVGDPKQMPPTNFFGRSSDDDESAEEETTESSVADLESILDEALATGMRLRRLTGHYRSRHESLIAFSNHAYYGGELVTYPAAETRPSAVSLVRVNGSYQKGKERTNPTEAKAVVEEISRRLRDPARKDKTIGVVTMNSEQQRLIRNLLDDERRRYPDIEFAFKGPDGEEEDMVYNLETVQGHERDVVFLSVGYGPTEPGGRAMSMNFGPLNRSGGERRLNVAITRATQEVVIFSSFGPEMIDLTRTKARAVEDLKHYLDFADRGPVALRQATREGLGPDRYDSPFEEAVAAALRARGWEIRTQVGASRFRVDLGVVHPDFPGRFLAGVECDGATYHGSAAARDRDRIRHEVLSHLGWTLLRLWSTDYFLDARASIARLHDQLTALLEKDRAQIKEAPPTPAAVAAATDSAPEHSTAPADSERSDPVETGVASQSDPTQDEDEAGSDDGDGRLYDDAYLPQLRQQCLELIDRAGPMQMGYLAARIARAHGYARTGKTIRSRIWKAVGDLRVMNQEPDGTDVLWPASMAPVPVLPFRGTTVEGAQRSWDETPLAERLGLAVAVLKQRGAAAGATDMAAIIGLGRLREQRRQELEALLAEARQILSTTS